MKLESMRDESFDVVQISVICLRGRDMGLVVVASSETVFKKKAKIDLRGISFSPQSGYSVMLFTVLSVL